MLLSCADELNVQRNNRSTLSLGEISFEVAQQEATLAERASVERVNHLILHQNLVIQSVDSILDWTSVKTLASQLFVDWAELYDRSWADILADHCAQSLRKITQNSQILTSIHTIGLLVQQRTISPHAPSFMHHVLTHIPTDFIPELLRWLAQHDGVTLFEQGGERSDHIRVLFSDLSVWLAEALSINSQNQDRQALNVSPWTRLITEDLWISIPPRSGQATSLPIWAVDPLSPLPNIDVPPFLLTPIQLNSGEQISIDRESRARSNQGESLYSFVDIERSLVGQLLNTLLDPLITQISPDFAEFDSVIQVQLPPPILQQDTRLGIQRMAHPHLGVIEPLLDGIVAGLDEPSIGMLMAWIGGLLSDSTRALSAPLYGYIDQLLTRLNSVDESETLDQLALTRYGFIDDLGARIVELISFSNQMQIEGQMFSTADLRVMMVSDLISMLQNSVFNLVEESSFALLTEASLLNGYAIDTDGAYEACANQCTEQYQELGEVRGRCLLACPRSEFTHSRVISSTEQSLLERALALIRDFDGRRYQLQVTSFSSPLLEGQFNIDSSLLPALIDIDNVAATFLASVAGEFRLEDAVSDAALESREVELLLSSFDTICSERGILSSILNSLLEFSERVQGNEVEERCQQYRDVRAAGNGADAKRSQVAVFFTLLSLLTDVPMDLVPTVGQLIRFFNLEDPEVELAVLQIQLSRLTCHEGYSLPNHHGIALYAGEATGLFDLLAPIARIAAKYQKLPELASLLGTISFHYTTENRRYPSLNQGTSPQAGTGLVTLEPWLAASLNGSAIIGPLLFTLSSWITQVDLPVPVLEMDPAGLPWISFDLDQWRKFGLSEQSWMRLQSGQRVSALVISQQILRWLRSNRGDIRPLSTVIRALEEWNDKAETYESDIAQSEEDLSVLVSVSGEGARATWSMDSHRVLDVLSHLSYRVGRAINDIQLYEPLEQASGQSDQQSGEQASNQQSRSWSEDLSEMQRQLIEWGTSMTAYSILSLIRDAHADTQLRFDWVKTLFENPRPLLPTLYVMSQLLRARDHLAVLGQWLAPIIDPLSQSDLATKYAFEPIAQLSLSLQLLSIGGWLSTRMNMSFWLQLGHDLTALSAEAEAEAEATMMSSMMAQSSTPIQSAIQSGLSTPLTRILYALTPLFKAHVDHRLWTIEDWTIAIHDMSEWLGDGRGIKDGFLMLRRRAP